MTTIQEIRSQTERKMTRSLEGLREEFRKIRTGRASTGLLDSIYVEYYGARTPLAQCASVNVADARTLTIQPYDRTLVKPIEKAIMESGPARAPPRDHEGCEASCGRRQGCDPQCPP